MRWLSASVLALAACDAQFDTIDVPGSAVVPPAVADAGGIGPDLPSGDVGPADASRDGGTTVEEIVVLTGAWRNAGYAVSGRSDIVQLPDGRFELRMSEDFRAANLPGPALFFSDRDRIGASGIRVDQGDVLIARLDEVEGPLVFSLPAEAVNRRFAWIYCEPFAAEMHVAEMVAP